MWYLVHVCCDDGGVCHSSGCRCKCADGNSAGSAAVYPRASCLHSATRPCHWPHYGPGQELRTSDHRQKDLHTVCRWRHIPLHFSYIIRPHCCTTYVDAAYCYRPSSMVCQPVCRSFTVVSPAKMAKLIEMPFGLSTRVGLRDHVLGGVHTGATWRIPLNCPYAAAMRPVVKLL